MLRRTVPDSSSDPGRGDPTQPMTHTVVKPRPAIVAPDPRAGSVRERMRAALVHLGASAVVVGVVCAMVFFVWYPDPLHQIVGVGAILWILAGVDVSMGPLFTAIVYDRRKKRLKWDLAAIVALQVAALAYGVFTLHQGRPAFVVLVKDRFEVVSPADLKEADRDAARGNPLARSDPVGPRWVAARMPDNTAETLSITLEAINEGRDVQHHPKLYVELSAESDTALARALPIARLRSLNAGHDAQIDALVAASGRPEAELAYLPLRGPARDGAVIIDRTAARVHRVVTLTPW